jgi:hypothetical protein
MIKCSYDVINSSNFVIYDVQYVRVTYGSKINRISILVNHKCVTHILNALIFMFLRICFKKMCSFINFFLRLYICIFIEL